MFHPRGIVGWEGGFSALRNFLAACKNEEEGDVVGEYFAAGGDAMEIIKLLDRKTDKNDLLFTVPLLSVLNQIIASEMRSGEELHRSTEAACRQLLYSHLNTVHFMLSAEASSQSRRIILTLLAEEVNPRLNGGKVENHPQYTRPGFDIPVISRLVHCDSDGSDHVVAKACLTASFLFY
uniref:Uncharacterized protein n=1 Tax=Timema shepardi TaxID=629360 RepID=A0A7R9ATD1_TIMSH|nr:unnamed protein product [Timema shepardi]